MGDLSSLDGFLDEISLRSQSKIHRALHIPMEMGWNKFKQLHPNNSMYSSIGVFVRSVKRIIKNKKYINTVTTKNRYGRTHFIILDSDKSFNLKDKTPVVIETPTDVRIKFMMSDMQYQVSDIVNKPSPPLPDLKHSTATVTPNQNPNNNPIITTKYPLLHSFGIKTQFETNEQQLVNLMSELVLLFKNSNKPLHFIHRGNDRPGLLVPIPKAKTYETFDKMERRNKWLENSLLFLNKDNKEDDTHYWLLKHLYKKSPHIFIKIATELGLVICHKMTDIEASAMWVEANVSLRAGRIILRHLQAKFGRRLQVPFSQISLLSDVTTKIQPDFGEFEYKKDVQCKKVPELMKYWTIKPTHLLELDFARLLSSMQNQATFGYESKLFQPTKSGVYAIIGADHGGGKSRYLIRVNYLPSSYRREVNKVDAGTRTVQFAEVACKKDVYPIQAKLAPIVNEAIKELEDSMLVAIKIGQSIICKFLPTNAVNLKAIITESNIISLKYSTGYSNEEFETKIQFPETINSERIHPVQVWTVIQSFKVVVAGDLSFFATSTGRDGHSHVRCVYCDSSSQSWNDNTSPAPNKMTLSKLQQLAKLRSMSKCPKKIDSKGVVMYPLFNVEPEYYIVPLLHLLIGVVNKLWTSLLFFLDEFVERITLRESDLKMKVEQCKADLRELDDEFDILTVNKQMACEEYAISNCSDVYSTINSYRDRIKKIKESKTKQNKELRQLKTNLVSEREKRKGNAMGIENLLYLILDESTIKKQHFHGGAMNGVCCRRLLDNLDIVFEKINKLISDKLKEQMKTTEETDYITLVFNKFRDLFEVVDLVFYRLRILDPTEEEIENTRKAISVLQVLWEDVDLNKGPKLHILFDHTIEQVERYKGIADLVEDFIEKYHQVGKRLDYLVARMSAQSFRQQELVKIRRQWLATNPCVHNHISRVHHRLKRKNNTIHSLISSQEPKILGKLKQERKKIKREQTERKTCFNTY